MIRILNWMTCNLLLFSFLKSYFYMVVIFFLPDRVQSFTFPPRNINPYYQGMFSACDNGGHVWGWFTARGRLMTAGGGGGGGGAGGVVGVGVTWPTFKVTHPASQCPMLFSHFVWACILTFKAFVLGQNMDLFTKVNYLVQEYKMFSFPKIFVTIKYLLMHVY